MAELDQAPQLTGGCQCGAVRYAIAAKPLEIFVCHCRECQKQSASAFGISVMVERAAFRVTRGELGSWSRPTGSGKTLACQFCLRCGSRLWHQSVPAEATISVKGGSLDEPVDLRSATHIWTSRKLAGVVLPDDARQYPQEPPRARPAEGTALQA